MKTITKKQSSITLMTMAALIALSACSGSDDDSPRAGSGGSGAQGNPQRSSSSDSDLQRASSFSADAQPELGALSAEDTAVLMITSKTQLKLADEMSSDLEQGTIVNESINCDGSGETEVEIESLKRDAENTNGRIGFEGVYKALLSNDNCDSGKILMDGDLDVLTHLELSNDYSYSTRVTGTETNTLNGSLMIEYRDALGGSSGEFELVFEDLKLVKNLVLPNINQSTEITVESTQCSGKAFVDGVQVSCSEALGLEDALDYWNERYTAE